MPRSAAPVANWWARPPMKSSSAAEVDQEVWLRESFSKSPLMKKRSPRPPDHAPLLPMMALVKKLSAGSERKDPFSIYVPEKVTCALVFLKMPLLVNVPVKIAGV